MVIFHSYVSLPEGNGLFFGGHSKEERATIFFNPITLGESG